MPDAEPALHLGWNRQGDGKWFRGIFVENGRVTALGPAAEVKVPRSATVIPGEGRYLLPGLTDIHTHPMTEDDLILFLANGITSIRSLWGEPSLLELRDRLEELEVVAGGPARRPPPSDAPGDSARDQTFSALLNLGYSRDEAERVLDEAAADAGQDATLENLVRASLKRLGR